MAQVVAKPNVDALIDDYLQYLLREWSLLPWVVSEWNDWGEHERLNFVLEWPIREDRLLQLRGWYEQDLLTMEQRSRYAELLSLVDRHRPTLERLLAE